MKTQSSDNWIDEFIYDEELSDEAIYAIYQFLDRLTLHFEMKTFCRLRNYRNRQQE